MTSTEPSEAEILQVIDFAGLDHDNDRSMVIQALGDHCRNTESVVMSYFDDPAAFRKRYTVMWNDCVFTADRNGEVDHGNGASFHIEEPNSVSSGYPMGRSIHPNDLIRGATPPPVAPSRPPSRTDVKSPLARMVDMTATNVPIFDGQSGSENLSQDMEWALRASAQEAGITASAQESGVLENRTSTPYFGPATRSRYDGADWAMVPVGPVDVTSNILPASDRKRKTDAPAFLVQHPTTVGAHRLGGLLTILHEIPLARNILLSCGSAPETYGYDNEWWKGKSVMPPQSRSATQDRIDLEWEPDHDPRVGFEDEIHRLMAFLDSTERSYGSASLLTDLIPYSIAGPEKQFYEYLGQRNGDKVSPFTQVASITNVLGDEVVGNEDSRFGLLEIELLKSDYSKVKTLYEAVDHLMWSDVLSWNELSEESKMAMLKKTGQVIAIKFGGQGPEDSLEIPVEFYPEKYLASRKQEASRIQKALCETKNAMMRLEQEKVKLDEWRDNFGRPSFSRTVTIQKASDQWKTLHKYLQSAGQFTGMQESGFDTNKYPDYHEAPEYLGDTRQNALEKVEDVLTLIEKVAADTDQKLKDINMKLDAFTAKLRYLGRLLTDPNKPGRPKPMTCKRYLLRGVATETDIIYVCQRQQLQADLIDLDDTPKKTDQWWRLGYVQGEEHPVKADKIEIERVLREVWQETKTPVLVYATEEALSVPNEALSDALERFVKADNKAFRQELSVEQSNEQAGSRLQSMDPISLSKRKHRSDSMNSLDSNHASLGSNHASLGSDGDNGFDNPFEDQEPSFSLEKGNYLSRVTMTSGLSGIEGTLANYTDLAGMGAARSDDKYAAIGGVDPPAYSDVGTMIVSETEPLPQRLMVMKERQKSVKRDSDDAMEVETADGGES